MLKCCICSIVINSSNSPANPQVYVVGEVGIQEELDLKGISHIGGPADAGKEITLSPGFALPHDPDVHLTQALNLFWSLR